MGVTADAIHAEEQIPDNAKLDSNSGFEYEMKYEVDLDVQSEQQVLALARTFTTQSQQHLESPFATEQNSRLDPNSDRFRARDWARSFYELRYNGEDAIARVAGVAFRGLDVWGEGSPTDFQATVGNKILKLPSLFGRGAQKVEILRNLDGLLLPSEQLCVLGPPG